MTYVLGVDAGNTKTIALVARLDGAIVGAGRAGCGDIYDTTRSYGTLTAAAAADEALTAVEGAARAALQAAGIDRTDLAAGAFNLAGADWPEDFDFLRSALSRRGFGPAPLVVHDSIGALRAGSADGTGVAVVCGTGAAIGARAPDGRVWHTSHWQEPQGAHELGRKTLWAVYRAELGIDPPTRLTARVLEVYGRDRVEDVLHLFTAREGTPPRDVDRLAPMLMGAAQQGDATARRIVTEHGAALGDYALAAARRVGIESLHFALVLAGGVLRHPSPLMRDAIIARVRTGAPGASAAAGRFEPVVGALLLAVEAAGAPVDEPLLARLASTLPPDSLFTTKG